MAAPPAEAGVLTWINAMLLIGTVLVGALLAWCTQRCWYASRFDLQGQPRALAGLSALLYGLALVTVIAIGLPILVLPPCI